MSADLLTVIPRRGLIHYLHTDAVSKALSLDEEMRDQGWFHLEDGIVMKRGFGDLRSWKFCLLANVIEFTPDPVQL